ncbi:THUMP domain-containing protein [Synechococcus sp. WH 8101]|uniref:THUMP domain-containing class I SAM-dependent RNA methyltransferase n=1 Tax=Synechococcus sp. WH 8101 TaxID=59932 RepID=UPI0010236C3A
MGRDNRHAHQRIPAVAVLPQGLEEAGAQELIDLGAKAVRPLRRAAAFEADMACLYRLHLQCRLPFRLLRELSRFPCDGRDSLYHGVQDSVDWERWLHPSISFRVDATGSVQGLNHSHYSALQVKNAIVDRQRELWGERSSIDLEQPDLHLHLHLGRGEAVLSLDGCGGSLHRRGYRAAMGAAPLKENLAAGLIRLTGWDGTTPLVDPLCGSGTLLIEAASLARRQCPGLERTFSLEGWADFNAELWRDELERARRRSQPQQPSAPILGWEQDAAIAEQARSNVAAAGLEESIRIHTGDFRDLSLPAGPGIVVCNPPYGVRIGAEDELETLYADLAQVVKREASGWEFWLLSGNPAVTGALRMKASRRIPISNGGIDCRWLHYQVR